MIKWIKKGVYKLNEMINKPEEKSPNNLNYLEYIVKTFKSSKERKRQEIGVNYYKGKHDILNKKKEVIGRNGELEEVKNIPCNKRIDNQYAIAVDKKVNYLLGRAPTLRYNEEKIDSFLQDIITPRFNRNLKNILRDSYNCGIGFMYVYIDDESNLVTKRLNPLECKAIWKDEEHQELEFLVRMYNSIEFTNGAEIEVGYAEVYESDKMTLYKIVGESTLIKIKDNYYIIDSENNTYSWGCVPIIAFKYNQDEIALIEKVKNLQDALNEMLSNFNDNMEEHPRNSIMVIHNYDGQDLGEFRKNLNTYGAVKVRNDGGVSSLTVDVNSQNYISIISLLKNAIIENAKSFDAKDDRLGANPNMMNIQSMYSDIDIDSNGVETEYKSAFHKLDKFIKIYLQSRFKVQISKESNLDIIFNKDVLINESQVISDIRNSTGILSMETLIENHPYIDDVKKEIDRIEKEKTKEDIDAYGDRNG